MGAGGVTGGRIDATPLGSMIYSCDDPVGAGATTGYRLRTLWVLAIWLYS
jgi:hypothetical protein